MYRKLIALILAAVLMMMPVLSCSAEGTQDETVTDNAGENEAAEQAEAEEETEGDQWLNILLLGGDSRSTSAYERTDSMIILSLNMEEERVKMTSIMRDTWVHFPGTDKSHRINAANVYGGPELAMKTVNEYFGTDIEKYVLINMSDMIRIVDLIGGVDITITEKERQQINKNGFGVKGYSGKVKLDKAGSVHLNGVMAMAYSRIRIIDSDYRRVERQQKVLMSLARSLQDMNVNDLLDIVKDLMAHVETNMELDELKELAMLGMMVDMSEVESGRIPADGTFESGLYNGTYKIIADFEENAERLHQFIYEDKPIN